MLNWYNYPMKSNLFTGKSIGLHVRPIASIPNYTSLPSHGMPNPMPTNSPLFVNTNSNFQLPTTEPSVEYSISKSHTVSQSVHVNPHVNLSESHVNPHGYGISEENVDRYDMLPETPLQYYTPAVLGIVPSKQEIFPIDSSDQNLDKYGDAIHQEEFNLDNDVNNMQDYAASQDEVIIYYGVIYYHVIIYYIIVTSKSLLNA